MSPAIPKTIIRGRVKYLQNLLAADLTASEFDTKTFDKHLLELSLLASDRQWQNALTFLNRTLDALPPK